MKKNTKYLYLGLQLDDRCKFLPIETEEGGTSKYLGIRGFLSFLENELGIPFLVQSDTLRLEMYRQALSAAIAEEESVFYASSFRADSWATAEVMLAMRDEILLSGWDLGMKNDLPVRFQTFAKVEVLLGKQIQMFPPGYAGRWSDVRLALQTGVKLSVEKITLHEPLALYPKWLQSVLKVLKESHSVQLKESNSFQNENTESTDLKVFQDYLSKKITVNECVFKGDGSLLLLYAEHENYAAEFVAKFIQLNDSFRPLCLIPEKNRTLDTALTSEGLPSLGILSASTARPLLQILKLAPAFLWSPPDLFKILEFVTLSLKPLDTELSNIIAGIISERPGLNSELWNVRVFSYLRQLEESAEGDAAKEKKAKKVREQYNFWFSRRRYDAQLGAPKDDIIEIFQYVSNWTGDIHDENNELSSLLSLAQQAQELIKLLYSLPPNIQTVTMLELERMVRAVYEPTAVVFREEEAGRVDFVHQPGAILTPTPNLLWWNFSNAESESQPLRWTGAELKYCAENGIEIELPSDDSKRRLWFRKQPILATTKQIVFVCPQKAEGVPTKPHPLFAELEACFGHQNLKRISVYLESGEQLDLLQKLGKSPDNILLETQKKQAKQPHIYLERPEKLKERETETYTALENLFYYPHQWVFRHKAELRKSSLLSVSKDNTLMGNLAHRLLEKIFEEKKERWSKADLEDFVQNNVQDLLEREGATLLMYGREPERVGFVQKMKSAAWTLLSAIQNNGWKVLGTEVPIEGDFMGIKIKGRVDLALCNDKGEHAIIDLKWRGARYKELIKNKQDLQLVLYSRLLTPDDTWAHTAYFLIESGTLYARNNEGFADARIVPPAQDHIAVNQIIWEQMEKTYQWRINQLKKGKIEIRTSQTSSFLSEPSELNIDELRYLLEMKTSDAAYDDYKTLI